MALTSLLSANANPNTYEQFLADHKVANRADKSVIGQHRLDWWRDARFGMFIHWDPSSVAACEISWSKLYYDDIGENLKPNPRPGPGLMGKTEWSENSARLLTGGTLDAKQADGRLVFSLDADHHAPVVTVMALEYDRDVTSPPVIQP